MSLLLGIFNSTKYIKNHIERQINEFGHHISNRVISYSIDSLDYALKVSSFLIEHLTQNNNKNTTPAIESVLVSQKSNEPTQFTVATNLNKTQNIDLRETTSPTIFIDFEKCSGCKECVKVCASDALTIEGIAKINMEKCILCGACTTVCPNQALTMP